MKRKKIFKINSIGSLNQKTQCNTKVSWFDHNTNQTIDNFTTTKIDFPKSKTRNLSQNTILKSENKGDNPFDMTNIHLMFECENNTISDRDENGTTEIMTLLSSWDMKNLETQDHIQKKTFDYKLEASVKRSNDEVLSKLEMATSPTIFKRNMFNSIKMRPTEPASPIKDNRMLKFKQRNYFNFDVFRKGYCLPQVKDDQKESLKFMKNETNLMDELNQLNYYHKTIREKERFEKFNRDEMIKAYKILAVLKIKKTQYKDLINDTYKLQEEAKQEFLMHKDLLKGRKMSIIQKYSSTSTNTTINQNQIEDLNFKDKIEQTYLRRKSRFGIQKNVHVLFEDQVFKDKQEPTESRRKSRVSEMRNAQVSFDDMSSGSCSRRSKRKRSVSKIMEDKMKNYKLGTEKFKIVEEQEKSCETKYMSIMKELKKIIEQNNEEISQIKHKFKEYERRFETLNKEQAIYYINLLKNGTDTRSDGLSWIIKRLLELNVSIETISFPNFLNGKQIDYLINLSKLGYESYQLNIFLKTLKIRHNQFQEKQKQKFLEKVNAYTSTKEDYQQFKIIKRNKAKDKPKPVYYLIDKIRKRLSQQIDNRKNMLKQQISNKIEEKITARITNSIKFNLKQCASDKQLIPILKKEGIIMNNIFKNDKSKEYIDNMRILRNRINELEDIIEATIREEYMLFKSKNKIFTFSEKDSTKFAYYNKIKNALFGTKTIV